MDGPVDLMHGDHVVAECTPTTLHCAEDECGFAGAGGAENEDRLAVSDDRTGVQDVLAMLSQQMGEREEAHVAEDVGERWGTSSDDDLRRGEVCRHSRRASQRQKSRFWLPDLNGVDGPGEIP